MGKPEGAVGGLKVHVSCTFKPPFDNFFSHCGMVKAGLTDPSSSWKVKIRVLSDLDYAVEVIDCRKWMWFGAGQ